MKTALIIMQVLAMTCAYPASAVAQDLDKLNLFVQSQTPSAAATAFREARDLIKDGEWQRAEARFNRFIADFPKDREVAAALYWLAFSLKRQDKFAAADATLTRLIGQYPSSQWLVDARALRVEMAPRLKNNQLIEQSVGEANDEIKIAALQSLLEARPERAIAIATDILKSGAGQSRLMKEAAISVLGDTETREAIPVLAQVARTDADIRVRRKAIEELGNFENEPALVDELIKMLASEKDPNLQEELIETLGGIELQRAQTALAELARTSASVEVRRQAIEALADQETESAAESLIKLYDAEKDERVKEGIIEALGESGQTTALRKLTQIARSDPSLRLRKQALSAIGDSDDPEAVRFLEELLKK